MPEEKKTPEGTRWSDKSGIEKVVWVGLGAVSAMALTLAGMGTAAAVKDLAQYIARPADLLVTIQRVDFDGDGQTDRIFYRVDDKISEYPLPPEQCALPEQH